MTKLTGKPAMIRLRGDYTPSMESLLSTTNIPVINDYELSLQEPSHTSNELTMESQQLDAANAVSDALNVFVIKPKQTGFTSVAALTQQAIANPEQTIAVVLAEPGLSLADQSDRVQFITAIKATGSEVFENVQEATNHIQHMQDENLDC